MRTVRYCHNNPYWGSSGLMLVRDGLPYGIIAFHVDRDRDRGWTFTFAFLTLRVKVDVDTPRARRRRAG